MIEDDKTKLNVTHPHTSTAQTPHWQLFCFLFQMKAAGSGIVTNTLLSTDLGLGRGPDGPDAVQSITRLYPFLLLHLTGANNPVPAADLKLTVCTSKQRRQKKTPLKKTEANTRKSSENINAQDV